MRSVSEERIEDARAIERKLLQGTATICSPMFGRAWKGMFPYKPAEELAAKTGCSVRTAAYELSGEIPPSAQSIKALVDLCVPPRK
jgi:hypothetical protein